MNITFAELDHANNEENSNQNQNQNQNQNPYFNEKTVLEKKSINNKKQRKGISYDDILSSMNTVVIDGKLEFIRNDSQVNQSMIENSEEQQNFISPQHHRVKKVQFSNPPTNTVRQQPQTQQQQQPRSQPPMDPSLKSSYIFNKYFKDYKDPTIVEQPKPQLTREELKKQVLIDYINRYNERNRINQIKSTKLQFDNNGNNVIRSRRPISSLTGSNHLFNFKHTKI
uniref:Uncharacterized protein n=1 Tax=viral metagenome TaxID=1070528 RepID=A0A6C0DJ13_9ZZZZ